MLTYALELQLLLAYFVLVYIIYVVICEKGDRSDIKVGTLCLIVSLLISLHRIAFGPMLPIFPNIRSYFCLSCTGRLLPRYDHAQNDRDRAAAHSAAQTGAREQQPGDILVCKQISGVEHHEHGDSVQFVCRCRRVLVCCIFGAECLWIVDRSVSPCRFWFVHIHCLFVKSNFMERYI